MARKVLLQEAQWIEAVTALVYPLTFLLAFGLGLQGRLQSVEGVPYTVFLIPGLVGYTLLLEAFSLGAWGLWLDRWHLGMLDEARLKPVNTSSIILGYFVGLTCVALIKGSITALVLCGLLRFVPVSLGNVLLFLAHLLPGVLLFACLGTMAGLVFKKPDNIAQSLTIVVTPLLYLGGLFFPVALLPQWLQGIVVFLPTAIFFEGGRHALLHGHWAWQNLLGVWGLALAAFAFTVWFFNRCLKQG
jgi:ABC-type multidrug transport system permease subunit